jgi:hypothetical protein
MIRKAITVLAASLAAHLDYERPADYAVRHLAGPRQPVSQRPLYRAMRARARQASIVTGNALVGAFSGPREATLRRQLATARLYVR